MTTTIITKRIFVEEGDHPLDFLEFYVDELKDAVIFIEKVCISKLENAFLATKEDEEDVYTIKEWNGHTAQVRAFSEEFYVVENATFKEGAIEYKRPEEPYRMLMVKFLNKQ